MEAARAQAGRGDPQSGPPQAARVPGFFHYSLQWIHAEEGRIVGLSKSHYINRQEEYAADRPSALSNDAQKSADRGVAASLYINRYGNEANPELGHHLLITRGLPVSDGAGLARLLDAKERKKDRTYRQYGGRMPRVGCHGIISFQWGITDKAAIAALDAHARLISDTLQVPLEAQIHNVSGRPDHAHILIGTRVVLDGKLGRKQRELDAVSEKHDGRGLTVDGRLLGSTVELLRSDWARRMREASGDTEVDHRSYARRKMAIYPVTHVPRSEIEYQRRRGRTDWRYERSLERRDRAAVLQTEATDRSRGPAGTEAAGPVRESRQHAPGIATPAPSVDQNSVEAAWERTSDLGLRSTREVGDAASGNSAAHEVGSGREVAALSVDTAPMIAAYRTLKQAHRLKADCERALSTLAGVDVEAFRRAAAEASDDGEGGAGQASPLPPDLMKMIVVWQEEDRRARAEKRRGRKTEGEPGTADRRPDLAATKIATPLHGGEVRPRRNLSPSRPASAPEIHAAPRAIAGSEVLARALWDAHADDVLARAYDDGQSPPSDDPEPASGAPHDDRRFSAISAHIELSRRHRLTAEREGRLGDPIPVPDVTAGPGATAGSEALARAVVDAHVNDIIARAYDANRPPLSDGELRRAVALRLRASEYDRAEIALTLRGRHVAGGLPGDIEVDRAVDEAFSDRSTAWLDARAGFCARAAQVSHRAEMATYRRLRNEALAQLQRDLDDVWRTRRADLDCVMAWHRRDMAWIRDLRWRNRRLRSRGLILAILSLAVELAVLRPLQALEQTITAQERRELDDAAKAATTRLRALREEWRTACGVQCRLPVRQDNRSAPQDKMTVGTSPDPVRVEAYSANAHHRPHDEASSSSDDRRIESSNSHSSVLDGEPSTAVASAPSAAGTGARASVFRKDTEVEPTGTPPVSTLAPLAAAVPLQAAPVPEPDRSIPSGKCKPANPRAADEPGVVVPPSVGPMGMPQGRSETAVPMRVDAPLPPRRAEPKPIPERGDGRLAELAANRGGDDRSIGDRRRLVVDYGLVLVAHGAWSSKRSAPMAALIGATPDALWKMVHRRCWERYGRNAPSAIDEADKQALRRDTWRSSKAIKFEDLLRVMTISTRSPRDRGRRDDD